ncbi:unnamed protein product [Symbiodinium natans]|uniref:C3H1-type domain-containing protein n=1 Tax=Symbiodinium natans TaxID=878477 RepID=A0A812QS34_9DINO|nr:unnamed protein product [Symbiodinium natans]
MGRGKAKIQIPECRYGTACTRRDCVFKHPPKPAKSNAHPVEKSDKVCFAFVAGKCAFGRQCHDKHPDEASCQSIKERYGKIDCQWGRGCRTDGCLYRHPSDEPVGPALMLETKPQPAVYAQGYKNVEVPSSAPFGTLGTVEAVGHEPSSKSASSPVPDRERPPLAADDEEEEEHVRQEQLAATLRYMGFDEEPSLRLAQQADGDLNRCLMFMEQDDSMRSPACPYFVIEGCSRWSIVAPVQCLVPGRHALFSGAAALGRRPRVVAAGAGSATLRGDGPSASSRLGPLAEGLALSGRMRRAGRGRCGWGAGGDPAAPSRERELPVPDAPQRPSSALLPFGLVRRGKGHRWLEVGSLCLAVAAAGLVFAQRLRGLPPGLDQRLNAGGHGSGHQGAQGAEPTERELQPTPTS